MDQINLETSNPTTGDKKISTSRYLFKENKAKKRYVQSQVGPPLGNYFPQFFSHFYDIIFIKYSNSCIHVDTMNNNVSSF